MGNRFAAVLATLFILAGVVMHDSEAQEKVDARMTRTRTNQEGANFLPPQTKAEWLARREAVRKRILVATGLFPMPEKTPLSPRIYGKLQRDGYTIEKVVLETFPGYFLSGNLYRPTSNAGKIPGILNPHGHWQNGRNAGDVQARCIGQARMGAVAFLYDMVGYADSRLFGHSFRNDTLLGLGLNLPGLQLWNSLRALDWLRTLPEVDTDRIAMTGESGGGTQTFLLCALDERIQVAAPVCMVSHHFQGGSECENAPHLRVGTDNVEIAACFAPRPMLLVGATGDWTSQILSRGVPEIRAVYRLFGAESELFAVVHQADHNYNQASRESVYSFLRHKLWGESVVAGVKEAASTPETEAVLSTWDAAHPRPANAATPAQLQEYLTGVVARQITSWTPRDSKGWAETRTMLAAAAATMLDCRQPSAGDLNEQLAETLEPPIAGSAVRRVTLSRRGVGDVVRCIVATSTAGKAIDHVTVVISPRGAAAAMADQSSADVIRQRLDPGGQVIIYEPLLTGKLDEVAKRQGAAYFAGYNKTILAERVQDVLTVVAYAGRSGAIVDLLGLGSAGPWTLLARPFAIGVRRTVVDAANWDWPVALPITDENCLPSARRYGGMKVLATLAAPAKLLLHNYGTGLDTGWLEAAYRLSDAKGALTVVPGVASAEEIVAFLESRRGK